MSETLLDYEQLVKSITETARPVAFLPVDQEHPLAAWLRFAATMTLPPEGVEPVLAASFQAVLGCGIGIDGSLRTELIDGLVAIINNRANGKLSGRSLDKIGRLWTSAAVLLNLAALIQFSDYTEAELREIAINQAIGNADDRGLVVEAAVAVLVKYNGRDYLGERARLAPSFDREAFVELQRQFDEKSPRS